MQELNVVPELRLAPMGPHAASRDNQHKRLGHTDWTVSLVVKSVCRPASFLS